MVLGIGEGKVELILDKTSYIPGEAIKGKVNLSLGQPQQARALRVEFFGEIERRTGNRRSGQHRTIERVFVVQKQISGEKSYSNGEAYGFEITVPANALPPKQSGVIVSFLNFFTPTPRWYLQATLDMPMKLDMNKKIPIQLFAPKPGTQGI